MILWLAAVLRAEGCKVREYSGWKSRGRPGSFDPQGVLWHHTGTTVSSSRMCPSLNICVNGRSDLPGPLCQVVICYDGTCEVIAAGRANHAGKAKASGPMPGGDGNAMYVGFEIDYNGTQAMSLAQYDAAIRAGAAVCRKLKRSANYCRGHRETSLTGKWDPGGTDLNEMRSEVNTRLAGAPQPPPDEGDDWLAEPADVWRVQWGRATNPDGTPKTAMNFIDTLDNLAATNTWTQRPWGSAEPASTAVALQQIHGWMKEADANIKKIMDALGLK